MAKDLVFGGEEVDPGEAAGIVDKCEEVALLVVRVLVHHAQVSVHQLQAFEGAIRATSWLLLELLAKLA